MTIPECIHGMPHPASCVDCMAEGPVVPPAPPVDVTAVDPDRPPFRARYPGECRSCPRGIEPGEFVVAHLDRVTYSHRSCTT